MWRGPSIQTFTFRKALEHFKQITRLRSPRWMKLMEIIWLLMISDNANIHMISIAHQNHVEDSFYEFLCGQQFIVKQTAKCHDKYLNHFAFIWSGVENHAVLYRANNNRKIMQDFWSCHEAQAKITMKSTNVFKS